MEGDTTVVAIMGADTMAVVTTEAVTIVEAITAADTMADTMVDMTANTRLRSVG